MVQRFSHTSMIIVSIVLSVVSWTLLRLFCSYWLDMFVTERVVDIVAGAFSDEVADLIGFLVVNVALLLTFAGVFWGIGAGLRKRPHA